AWSGPGRTATRQRGPGSRATARMTLDVAAAQSAAYLPGRARRSRLTHRRSTAVATRVEWPRADRHAPAWPGIAGYGTNDARRGGRAERGVSQARRHSASSARIRRLRRRLPNARLAPGAP